MAQAITFLVSLALARLYTDHEFGDFAVFSAAVIILSSLATGRYEMAIMLPKEQRDAVSLLVLSLLITAVVSIVVLIVIFFAQPFLTPFFHDQGWAVHWLFLIPLTVFIKGCLQAVKVWSNRNKQFSRNATGAVSNASLKAAFSVGWGVLWSGAWGLIVAQALGFFQRADGAGPRPSWQMGNPETRCYQSTA